MHENTRYLNKPFLRLLEFYVLWAINCLPNEQELLLVAMTPKLQKTYESTGEWHELIAQQMDLSGNLKNTIRVIWERNKEMAILQGYELTSEKFAMDFVDVNFPH